MLIDDAHWADGPSWRFLAYLAERIAALPVAVIVAVRAGESGPEPRALSALQAAAGRQVLSPPALSDSGVAALVRARLPHSTSPFISTCAEVTSGNPFLLTKLIDEVVDDHLTPDARHGGEADRHDARRGARLGRQPTGRTARRLRGRRPRPRRARATASPVSRVAEFAEIAMPRRRAGGRHAGRPPPAAPRGSPVLRPPADPVLGPGRDGAPGARPRAPTRRAHAARAGRQRRGGGGTAAARPARSRPAGRRRARVRRAPRDGQRRARQRRAAARARSRRAAGRPAGRRASRRAGRGRGGVRLPRGHRAPACRRSRAPRPRQRRSELQLVLVNAYLGQGRHAEAASVVSDTLPDRRLVRAGRGARPRPAGHRALCPRPARASARPRPRAHEHHRPPALRARASGPRRGDHQRRPGRREARPGARDGRARLGRAGPCCPPPRPTTGGCSPRRCTSSTTSSATSSSATRPCCVRQEPGADELRILGRSCRAWPLYAQGRITEALADARAALDWLPEDWMHLPPSAPPTGRWRSASSTAVSSSRPRPRCRSLTIPGHARASTTPPCSKGGRVCASPSAAPRRLCATPPRPGARVPSSAS